MYKNIFIFKFFLMIKLDYLLIHINIEFQCIDLDTVRKYHVKLIYII